MQRGSTLLGVFVQGRGVVVIAVVTPLAQGTAQGKYLIFKNRTRLANKHMAAQSKPFAQKQLAVFSGHHQTGDFFA